MPYIARYRKEATEMLDDAQLRTLLVTEQELNPAQLEPVLHFDGTPITARFIAEAIAAFIQRHNVEPISKGKVA